MLRVILLESRTSHQPGKLQRNFLRLRQSEQLHACGEPVWDVAVYLCGDFAMPALRLHHPGQGNKIALAAGFAAHRLLDDFERVSFVRPVTGGAQQCAQGASRTSLAADDLAHVAFGDFEFDDIVVEFLDEDFVRGIDQRFRNQLNESAHISRGLSHNLLLMVKSKA